MSPADVVNVAKSLTAYVLGVLSGMALVGKKKPHRATRPSAIDPRKDFKMVLVVNTMLKMGKGKIGKLNVLENVQVVLICVTSLRPRRLMQEHSAHTEPVELWRLRQKRKWAHGSDRARPRSVSKQHKFNCWSWPDKPEPWV
jgi:hypothetical protein